MDSAAPETPQKQRGNAFGFWFFQTLIRLTGLRGAYGFLHFVCLYYLLFDRRALRSVRPYLSRRFPQTGVLKRTLYAYRIFYNQGQCLIDRFALLAGHQPFDITFEQSAAIDSLLANPQGYVLLTSHVGNWQVVMHTLQQLKRKVYLLMRPEDNEALRKTMQIGEGQPNMEVITTDEHLGGVVKMMQVLAQGDVVSIMGDRSYQNDHVTVDLLGERASLPYSAFRIAAAGPYTVAVLFSAKTGRKSYSVEISEVIQPTMSRKGDADARWGKWVQQYASAWERYVERYPFQCFLFQDLWCP